MWSLMTVLNHTGCFPATDGSLMAEPVKIHFLWRPQLRDPSDEMVLETAVNGRADLLVTFNERDHGTVPERFGIQVTTPRRASERIGK
jgi:predicted nucleic acid-binding protein